MELTVKEHTTGLCAVENSPSYFLLMMYKFVISPTNPSGSNPSSCRHRHHRACDKQYSGGEHKIKPFVRPELVLLHMMKRNLRCVKNSRSCRKHGRHLSINEEHG